MAAKKNGLEEWRALYSKAHTPDSDAASLSTFYGVCIPRILHLILQETIYGSISDGGRKTVCISETALIYALTLMFNVLKSLIAQYSLSRIFCTL